MNIIDAMKSGRRFRRKGNQHWCDPESVDIPFYRGQIIDDSWEVEEDRKAVISESELLEFYNEFMNSRNIVGQTAEAVHSFYVALQLELGLR